jgi:hypothetical protein
MDVTIVFKLLLRLIGYNYRIDTQRASSLCQSSMLTATSRLAMPQSSIDIMVTVVMHCSLEISRVLSQSKRIIQVHLYPVSVGGCFTVWSVKASIHKPLKTSSYRTMTQTALFRFGNWIFLTQSATQESRTTTTALESSCVPYVS